MNPFRMPGAWIWGMFTLSLFALSVSIGVHARTPTGQSADLNGRWVSNDSPSGRWTFDLNVTGNTVTGRVICDGGEPGPSEIVDGAIDGSTVTFSAKNPVAAKNIRFTGRVDGNRILFERSVQIRAGGPIDRSQFAAGLDLGVFGSTGPMRFTATRTGAIPKPDTPLRPGSSEPVNPTGRWESLRGNLDVWVLELKADGPILTGSVSNTPGPGRQQMVGTRSVAIVDGKIDGATLTFKCQSPDNVRTISFMGIMQGDEIAFTRTVEIPPGGAFGPDNIFSAYAPMTFLARRPAAGTVETPELARLKQAESQWEKRTFKRYEFAVSFTCLFCTLPSGPEIQRVNDAAINPVSRSAFGSLNQSTALREMFYTNRGSIDAVFNLIGAFSATRPHLLEAKYDPELGYPVSVEIHPGGISADDNLRIEITNLRKME